jgi:hypothetical protein
MLARNRLPPSPVEAAAVATTCSPRPYLSFRIAAAPHRRTEKFKLLSEVPASGALTQVPPKRKPLGKAQASFPGFGHQSARFPTT